MRTIVDKYSLVPGVGVVVFAPGSLALTGASMAATAVAGGISASGTIAGGNYAATAGQMQRTAAYAKATEQDYEAGQVEANATQAVAAGQRQALDTREKTRLVMATSRARAAGSGVNAGVGSPVANEEAIAGRGEYHALMDLFNGVSTSTGLKNQAAGLRYGADITRMGGDAAAIEGEEKKKASRLAALGTLAGTAGNMLSTYGRFQYPTTRGATGASV